MKISAVRLYSNLTYDCPCTQAFCQVATSKDEGFRRTIKSKIAVQNNLFREGVSMKKRIGILTSGGDCPGLNATIRGAAKAL
ncbi:MAG: hypothetical protein RR754_08850, partial [Oscillospiraceae bacterium]